MTFPPEVWSGVLRRLHETLPAFTYEAWVAPLLIGEACSDRVVVLCPTPFHRDRVRHTLREPIADAFSDEIGTRPPLDFDVAEPGAAAAARASAEGDFTGSSQIPSAAGPDSDASTHGADRPGAAASGQGPDQPARSRTRDGRLRRAAMRRVSPDTQPPAEEPRPEPQAEPRPGLKPEPNANDGAMTGPLAGALAQTTSRLRVGRPDVGADDCSASARGTAPGGPRTARSRPGPRPVSAGHHGGGGMPAHMRGQRGPDTQQAQLPYPFSFDNFVVGPCNALAREAAFAVAGGQQTALKQLYLASPPGLGKTHLARAVAAAVAQQSRRTVRYANAEVFTSEFVSALRSKTTTEFKRRYRPERGGMLVLEDVQFLAAKRATQLEFFHSVQHVLDAGGRVLLTGDRMPQEMDDLDERLREQLAGGFVAALEAPDAIVRRQILKVKAANGAIALPDECLDLLIESVPGNVRELESVLMQVVTTSTLLKRPIDIELTRRAIAQKVQTLTPKARRPEISDVVAVVASFFKTTPEMLAARSRRRAVLVPRQLAMYLCHKYTEAPLADIGRALDRDHPSVRNAIKKVEREMLENPRLRYQVEALTTRIHERMG